MTRQTDHSACLSRLREAPTLKAFSPLTVVKTATHRTAGTPAACTAEDTSPTKERSSAGSSTPQLRRYSPAHLCSLRRRVFSGTASTAKSAPYGRAREPFVSSGTTGFCCTEGPGRSRSTLCMSRTSGFPSSAVSFARPATTFIRGLCGLLTMRCGCASTATRLVTGATATQEPTATTAGCRCIQAGATARRTTPRMIPSSFRSGLRSAATGLLGSLVRGCSGSGTTRIVRCLGD
jgi:hypothetical protein